MKIVLLLLCIAFAGCGAKSKEDIAKDLINEKLKTSLPDFKNYESLNFGALGSASLPYEESGQNIANTKAINSYKDSISLLENIVKENKTIAGEEYRKNLKRLQDSLQAKNQRNNDARQSYTPEKLYKVSHAYILKDESGNDKKTEDEFYIDEGMTRVVKVHKVY